MRTTGPRLARRLLLKGGAGLLVGLQLGCSARAQSGADKGFAPNAFIRIGTDDTVTVIVKHIEFGQGPFTALATLAAEELDADWSQMRAEHAPADILRYRNSLIGPQITGGSSSVADSWLQMRNAGAVARAALVQAAARAWSVPAAQITVERGVIRHAASNREGRFGQFAEAASRVSVPAHVPLKQPAAFRLIGKEGVARLDVPAKVNGAAAFAIDIQAPDMLTVVVARPPRFGALVRRFDDAAARAVAGVVDVRQVPTGVAVYAKGYWPAAKARNLLRIEWDESGAETRGSDDLIREFRALARQPGQRVSSRGNADSALSSADRVIEAEFVFPYLAQAPMEPLDAYLQWDGSRAVARFGCQSQTGDHLAIAEGLRLLPHRVKLETMFAGGSFGRRAQPSAHLAKELAAVAKAIGPNRPVKLVWSREDDLHGGYYRPLFVHRMRGAVRDGRIIAWSDTVVGQSILQGTIMAPMAVPHDPLSVEGARELLYEIPHFRCDLHTPEVGVPVLWFRSVGHTHTAYAVECFVDELLQAAGQDPVHGRLAMMGRSPRAIGVLNAVARLAEWSGPGPVNGRARGVAVVESFKSFVAQIAEVSLGQDGVPVVHKVWCAVDCGVAVNPDIIRAQMEGGIGFGLGHALFAEITLDAGRPVQGNFDSYRSLRIGEMPEIAVGIVPSDADPTGVGEPGVPPIAPAVANALARLGRERPRRLPMVREGA